MLVFIKFTNKKVLSNTPLSNNLLWYDDIKKEMITFKGGKLSFEYKEDPYLVKMGEAERQVRGIQGTFRSLPKVEGLEIKSVKQVLNDSFVESFLSNYLNYNNTEIDIVEKSKDGILVDIPKGEGDDFLYQLDRNNFVFEVR